MGSRPAAGWECQRLKSELVAARKRIVELANDLSATHRANELSGVCDQARRTGSVLVVGLAVAGSWLRFFESLQSERTSVGRLTLHWFVPTARVEMPPRLKALRTVVASTPSLVPTAANEWPLW